MSRSLTLKRPVRGIKPIRLATASQNTLEGPGHRLTVAGWGSLRARRQSPDRMRQASVPWSPTVRRRKAYSSGFLRYFPRLMVAAGAKRERLLLWRQRRAAVPAGCRPHAGRDSKLRARMREAPLPRGVHGGQQSRNQDVYRRRRTQVAELARLRPSDERIFSNGESGWGSPFRSPGRAHRRRTRGPGRAVRGGMNRSRLLRRSWRRVIRNPHEHCRCVYKLAECTSHRASLSP